MKKHVTVFLLGTAFLAAAAAFTGCGGGNNNTTNAGNTTAKLAGTWRVYHTPNGGAESPADTWGITSEPGNDAALTITSSGSGSTFNGTVNKTTITASLPDYSYTVTMTGTVVTVTDAMIGYTMSGTYSSTSGETGTWRGANLAYVTLQSIQVAPTEASVVVGNTTSFTAAAVYSDGYEENVTGKAVWSPAIGSIATVSGGVARGWSAGDALVWASIGTVGSNVAVLHVTSGGGGSAPSGISTDINSPSVVSLGTTTNTWIAASALGGYIDFPTTDGKGYGIYVMADSPSLSLDAGYNNGGTWASIGVGAVNPSGTSDYLLGFKAGAADYMAKLSNSASNAVAFAFIVREVDLGGSPLGTPLAVSLGAPTWIGAAWLAGDFAFVAGGSTATLQFDSLTAGVDVAVYEADKTTVVLPKTTDGTETQLTKTVDLTGLTYGNTYVVRVSSLVAGTSGASVGRLTITSSGGGGAVYNLASLSGAWLVDTTLDRNAGYDFFITDGSGTLTSSSFYSAATPTYSVQDNGDFTLTIPITGPSTFDVTGTLTSSGTGSLSGIGPNSTISKLSDLTRCQGTWTGTLSTGYDVAFTIKSDGTLDTAATRTITGGTINSGAMVGQGSLCVGYFTTDAAEPYNAFRINGTLTAGTPPTLTGNFDNDSGIAWPVGTVSLTQ